VDDASRTPHRLDAARPRRRTRWRVYLALIVAALLWGSLYPAAKPAVSVTGPIQVSFCRVCLACLCLGSMVLLRSGPGLLLQQLRSHWRAIGVLGLCTFAVSQILAMLALAYLPASVNGLLNNTHPLWVAVGTALFYPPRRPALVVAGSTIALAGVGIIFLPDVASDVGAGAQVLSPLGMAFSLAGSGVIALGTALGRRIMPGSDPLAVSALASGFAILPMTLLTLASGGFGPILEAPGETKLLLLYVGVGCTALNNWLWYYGLKHLSAAAASAFQYMIPPMSVAIAAIFLHEPLSLVLVLGTLCILVGLVATQLGSTDSALRRTGASAAGLPLAPPYPAQAPDNGCDG
jgi:drug/metabolite transporter (DMT)-like permease